MFDLMLAGLARGAAWALHGQAPGWDGFGSVFALPAVLTALVSFGPISLRRFLNAFLRAR
ncbi:MAG: hypothetical protein F4137_05560 [Acidobacteria bacterium]|nr:hypothetical protein [Acidobacteriota bacterium]MYH28318.1 hypothetical protein [Acidobacteriota bacterium]